MSDFQSSDRDESSPEIVEPVNIVAGGGLNQEISLDTLVKDLANVDGLSADYTDDDNWQLVIDFVNSGKILLYSTGSYIVRGGSSFEMLEQTKEEWFDLLESLEVISDRSTADYEIQNIVYLSELSHDIDLAELAILLGLDQTEYEPEQFPGLIYRPLEHTVVSLAFSSGKIITTGSTNPYEAAASVHEIEEHLQRIHEE